MKKIAITGSNGLLGQSLLSLFLKDRENYQVSGISQAENRSGRIDFEYHSVDMTNEELLRQCLLNLKPDYIINTAAMTNVDACEENQQACDAINVDAVRYLTLISEEINAHLIHLSTDFIFDGKKGFYKETDVPNPLSYYGLSKLKSEEIIIKSSIKHTILRTILVYGKVFSMTRSNIVLWVKEMLENNKEITIVEDQYRMPTFVNDLAIACKITVDKDATGVFHISSNQLLSVYEIAQQIAEVFCLNQCLIKPISTETLSQKALRPPKTGFDLSKTKKVLDFHPASFKEDLCLFKETLI